MPRTVQLFITSLLDSLYPDTCEAVVRVLALAGVEVHLADGQTCCGQPALNAALRADAHRMAMYTMRAFENAPGEVVVPPGSCADMIRYQYPELFADDAGWLSWHAYPALRSSGRLHPDVSPLSSLEEPIRLILLSAVDIQLDKQYHLAHRIRFHFLLVGVHHLLRPE